MNTNPPLLTRVYRWVFVTVMTVTLIVYGAATIVTFLEGLHNHYTPVTTAATLACIVLLLAWLARLTTGHHYVQWAHYGQGGTLAVVIITPALTATWLLRSTAASVTSSTTITISVSWLLFGMTALTVNAVIRSVHPVHQIWWANIRRDDNGMMKDRPVLIVSRVGSSHLKVAYFTSRNRTGQPGYHHVPAGTVNGLDKESWLNLADMRVIARTDLRRRAGGSWLLPAVAPAALSHTTTTYSKSHGSHHTHY